GGFSNDEIEFLEKNKFTSQSLGENILRTETAAICSVFNIHSLL
ncbi:MAG: 16S rRNA (uracil(1498)-N(3))-methyltransferase, partial [Chloroflexi bacterium]|nr:16S rRNA (uracil(1498)-N(3))-methyltransferase [Chloroflexota bacterium]